MRVPGGGFTFLYHCVVQFGFLGRKPEFISLVPNLLRAEGDQRFHAKAKWYELDSAGRKVGSWNLKHLSRCLSPTDGFICRRSALQRGGVGGAPL